MKYDILIIGAGPGGYEMAAEAAHRGLNVAIVERGELGGTCLNRGCIPTKALCRNAEVLNLLHDAEAFGVSISGMEVDYAKAVERKDAVVNNSATASVCFSIIRKSPLCKAKPNSSTLTP